MGRFYKELRLNYPMIQQSHFQVYYPRPKAESRISKRYFNKLVYYSFIYKNQEATDAWIKKMWYVNIIK